MVVLTILILIEKELVQFGEKNILNKKGTVFIKDLKFWLRRGVPREKIAEMIKLKSPEDIKKDEVD